MEDKERFLENFDLEFERTLPKEFLKKYTIIECFNYTEKSYALLAEDKDSHKKVVAKCFSNTNFLYENNEFNILKDTDSSQIPRFVEEFKNDNYYIVLREYVEGISLDEYMRAQKLDYKSKLELAIRLARAMRELHSLNPAIIHRDIKPQNIIVKNDGNIAFIDFEISRIYKQGEQMDTTIGGTAGYAAPEQYGFMQTDIRSDIYSYGIVLAWMLKGRAEPLKDADKGLEKISRKCTEFLPDKRYKNDDALISDLKKLYEPYDEIGRKRRTIRVFAISLLISVVTICIIATCIMAFLKKKWVYEFSDPIIEDAVRASLDKPYGGITYDDLEEVIGIYIIVDTVYPNYYEVDSAKEDFSNNGKIGDLKDLSDLKNMPNLEELIIVGEQIQDISPLENLDKLEYVDLQCNRIEDISALSDKDNLVRVCLNDNKLKSIDALGSCSELRFLDLNGAGSFDGSPVANLKKLNFLDIVSADTDAYNYIDGISFDELKIGCPGQTDLSCMENVYNTDALYIFYSDITDISALSGRTDITYFNMWGTKVNDLTPLWEMPNLKEVHATNEQKSNIKKYIELLGEPQFEIIYDY